MSTSYPMADASLARRIERAWAWTGAETARSYAGLRPEAAVAIEEFESGNAVYYGPGSPLSQAQGLGHDGPVTAADLDRLEALFHRRNTAAAIEVASLADPGLLPALCERGFGILEQSHVLVRPTRLDADPAEPFQRPGALTVAAVANDDATAIDVLTRTILEGFFEGPDPLPESVGLILTASAAATETFSGWLARQGEDTLGAATLFVHDGLGLFAGDATKRHARRRGVHAALIAARLAESARRDCDLAVTCTQPGSASQRNYERLGFRMVYARTMMVKEC